MSLQKKIIFSIFNMGVQRAIDLVSTLIVTIIVVRSLTRQEYGVLSVVLSYGLIFNIFNVSISSILLRDYQKIKGRINEYMYAFVMFAVMKGFMVLILSGAIGFILYRRYYDPMIIAVLMINAVCTILLYLTEPFAVLLSVEFKQSVLTKINFISSLTNIVLSTATILVPTAIFVSAKNALVALLCLLLTIAYARKIICAGTGPFSGKWVRLVKECFFGFSMWSHLIGVMTDIVYRADLLILGWLGAPFRTVGNYNIALQVSNFTKLLPQILQYNATLSLSNTERGRQQEDLTFTFIKYSFLLSLGTMVGYVLFGRIVIQIIAGDGVGEIYQLGFYIIAGLCVFNALRPLISYGVTVHNIQECFYYAILPSSLGTIACYITLGIIRGATGLAMANLIGGLIMVFFTLAYIHRKTEFRWRLVFVTDMERKIFARVIGMLRR